MLIISHRGDHTKEPENTLPAFESAIKIGVDGIEIDVRLSRDGYPILFHDRVLINGHSVSELNHRELEKIVGYSVPTLNQALAFWKDILWNIEIKSPIVLETIIPILRKYIKNRKLLITSFHHNIIAQCSKILEIDLGLIIAHRPLELSMLKIWKKYKRVKTIVCFYEIIDKQLINEVKELGFKNFIYGVKTQYEHNQCLDFEVDGIITDYPKILIKNKK